MMQDPAKMSSNTIERDLVSIVIPTYRRLADLRLAVESALHQTYPHVEVIVVSDGPDAEVRAALESFHSRLRYFELDKNSGPAEARNLGVRVSRGEWISFLDDDDTILPEKIEHQMRLADRDEPQYMIGCRTIYRHDGKDDVWPRNPLMPGEDLSEYILVRPSLLERPGVVPIQTLLIHRSLLAKVPLRSEPDHEDWSWLLEVWHLAGARIKFVWEPLVIYNIATNSISRSRRTNWQDSLQWALRNRNWITDRALNSFVSTKVALKAKRARSWTGLREVMNVVVRNRPGVLDLMFLAGVFLLPGFVLHAAWKRSLGGSKQPSALPTKSVKQQQSGASEVA